MLGLAWETSGSYEPTALYLPQARPAQITFSITHGDTESSPHWVWLTKLMVAMITAPYSSVPSSEVFSTEMQCFTACRVTITFVMNKFIVMFDDNNFVPF